MAGDRPLLARADSRDSIQEAAEEDALLTGQPTGKTAPSRWRRYREAGMSLYAILTTITIIVLAFVVNHESKRADRKPGLGWDDQDKLGKRNLIFMVSDGMGPTSLSMTRSFRQNTQGLAMDDVLALDEHLIGSSRTRSSNSLITDSAAGATAFSCGLKSYNGAISVDPHHNPCGTVLEAAKKAGYMTGLVVTTRITDATPACFASHANRREYEDLIAEHLVGNYPLGRMVDVLIGGGRCFFLPNTTSASCRSDSTDVVKMAKERFGFQYVDNRKDFDSLASSGDISLPLLALLADTDIPYEIDRIHIPDQYPSQSEMAQVALDALEAATKDSDKGFFLMIEGSRIDHAAHGNDPAAQVREVLEHDKTFTKVLDFLEKSDTPGVLISTSDHETGGLAAGRQIGIPYPVYRWYPQVLANATHSASYVAHKWAAHLASHAHTPDSLSRESKRTYIRTRLLEKSLGIYDSTSEEIDSIIDAKPWWPPSYLFAEMISQRAQIGWSTHGHTAVDVNIYASKPENALPLVGNHENVEVGRFLADFLGVDTGEVTKELVEKGMRTHGNEGGNAWMGPLEAPSDFVDSMHRQHEFEDLVEQQGGSDEAWVWDGSVVPEVRDR